MSTPTSDGPYTARVVFELVVDGAPRRVHVWRNDGQTLVSFPAAMTEEEAQAVVAEGRALAEAVDVPALFRKAGRRRRRLIGPD